MVPRSFLFQAVSAAGAALLLVSCGGAGNGSKPPQPGTPAFAWSTGQQAYKVGNYAKASDQFLSLAKGKSEFAERARPMALVTSLAMANAHMDLAEKLADGAKKARKGEAVFRRYTSEYRAQTQASAMAFVEESGRFLKVLKESKAAEVKLELTLPPEGPDEPAQYAKFKTGLMVPEAEMPGIEREVVERELRKIMVKQLSVGSTDGGMVKSVDFRLMLAQGLFGISEMFAPKKLNQPTRLSVAIFEQAQQALEDMKDKKEAAALLKKIAEAQKKLPKQ